VGGHAYAILFGGVLLLGGRLADLVGRRRLFVAGIALFTAASLFNGLTWTGTALIVGRAVQGLGAALLVPAALSLLVTIFPEGPERNRALGIWAAASAGGGSFGLLLGGVLTDALSWNWIFFINIPIGALVLCLAPVFLPSTRTQVAERRLDVLGAAAITGGLMLLVYGLTGAAETSWSSPQTIVCLGASVALIAAFVVIEARAVAPLLPLSLFRMRTLTASNLSGVFTGSSYVVFFLGSLYAQQVLHYSAIETGAAFLATSLSIILGSGIAQALIGRIGVRPVIPTGFALATVGLLLLAQAPADGDYLTNLLPAFVVFGLGMSFAFVGQQIGAQLRVAPADAGIASGLINTSQQVGAAVAVAVGTTLAATATATFVDAPITANRIGAGLPTPPSIWARPIGIRAQPGEGRPVHPLGDPRAALEEQQEPRRGDQRPPGKPPAPVPGRRQHGRRRSQHLKGGGHGRPHRPRPLPGAEAGGFVGTSQQSLGCVHDDV
jgi:EmrB/QacA subfamily drug resistance transporter